MKILVATASRHGSTREIGSRLADEIFAGLRTRGVEAEVEHLDAGLVGDVAAYDAVVLGSAVYLGRWLKDAVRLAERRLAVQDRPVWLFSSGPVVEGDDAENLSWARTPWAVEHHMFGGKLDRSVLSWHERLAVRAARAPDGDRRSDDEIVRWAATICAALAERR
ncbi:flavodoxin domain-containing protein [Cellulomonas sp. Marseille-Q8402]